MLQKLILFLFLSLFSAQGIAVFAFPSEVPQFDEQTDNQVKEVPVPGTAHFDETHILKIEPAPEKELPVVFSLLSENSSGLQRKKGISSLYNYFLRDQKKDLKNLIFPFHAFW